MGESSTEPGSGSRDESGPVGLPGGQVVPVEDAVDLAEQARVFEALFPDATGGPVKVGRFELQRRLGRGGMGEVYVAYDDRLDRQVALKLLLRERSVDEHARRRMLREAQVLARLSHPNVVQIYEAGVHEDQVFLAMELVDGVTLRQWLEQRPEGAAARPWTEVLPVMIEAGRGLAAAHAAGLTHRDFKPDNVLVGSDGRVRVLDFGLARPGSEADERTDESISKVELASSSGTRAAQSASSGPRREIALLTEPGAVVGTLAYMSPEQLAARPLDGRTDQFSFCVTLFEALYGERPFKGRTLAAHMLMVTQGVIEEPASRMQVPRWLQALVRRGLSVSPDDRFADMEALLRELSRARGRRWAMGLSVGVMLAVVGGASVLASDEAPCEQADAELAGRWDDAARAGVREGFEAAAPSYGADVAARTIAALDVAVDGWRAEQVDACEDTRVRQTHTEELLALRTACIERHTALLHALLDALPGADAKVVEHAHELVAALPGPVRCQDLDALGPEAPEDPAQVRSVREALATARLERLAGRVPEARATADEAVARAEAIGHAPAHAEALVEAALVRENSQQPRDYEQAAAMLWQALDLSELHDHDALLFEIWIGLQSVERSLGHRERAQLCAQRAEVSLERSPGEPRRRLELALRRGVFELDQGDVEASERWLRRGLDDASTQSGSELKQAELLDALGQTLRRGARLEEARRVFERAERIWRARLGPEHPYLARHAFDHGLLLVELGELDAARERLLHARSRWIASYGPKAPWVGRAELALADLDQTAGALDDALEHATRGHEIVAASHRADDPMQVQALQILGLVRFRRGELRAAHDTWRRALERLLENRPPDDPDVLLARSNVAEALLGLGQHAEARAAYEEILPAAQVRAETDPLVLMLVLKGLGLAELGSGRPAEAIPRLRAALERLERVGGFALERADLQWALARAERGSGEPAATVRVHAEQAADLYAGHGQAGRAEEIRTWLAELGAGSGSRVSR